MTADTLATATVATPASCLLPSAARFLQSALGRPLPMMSFTRRRLAAAEGEKYQSLYHCPGTLLCAEGLTEVVGW